jgi:hypothetical protein
MIDHTETRRSPPAMGPHGAYGSLTTVIAMTKAIAQATVSNPNRKLSRDGVSSKTPASRRRWNSSASALKMPLSINQRDTGAMLLNQSIQTVEERLTMGG